MSVTRELLVRHLDTWAPATLRRARRATFALAWPEAADDTVVEAALRVFAEFADRVRGRELTVVVVAPGASGLAPRVAEVRADAGIPADLAVHPLDGPGDETLPVGLRAARAAGAPLLAYVETAGRPPLAALAAGRPAEVLLVGPPGRWPALRADLDAAGFSLTAGVELVDATRARLLAFGTSSGKSLESFKDELWAVDEYAGVRYRDPGDPDGHLLDISLHPHPGPLSRELLAHLAEGGPATVSQLRQFTMTDTVYRAADTVRVLGSLLHAGTVTRDPQGGRLSGEVVIAPA